MKSYKTRDRSLYVLLIKNYIIFSLVMVLIMVMLTFLKLFAEKSIIQSPRVDRPLGGQEALLAGEYEKLSLKKLLGAAGFIEVLDENRTLLYSDYGAGSGSYTERELQYIPFYDTSYLYTKTEYTTKENEKRILITQKSYEWDTGYEENIMYMILDQNLTVIESNRMPEGGQFSQRELNFLTMREDAYFDICKYEFTGNDGKQKTLLMHIKRMDRQRYQKLSFLEKLFIPVFILAYVIITLGFTIRMRRKVKEPLDMLNEGFLSFAEGNRDTELSYRGPKEFETIFDSFNKMARLLKESEKSKEKLIIEKQRMLADISHDLKTPITVIQGYAKAVSDGLTDAETEKQYLNTIFLKTENLTELINTFYDYSKLEHPEFRLVQRRQDLAEFVREYLASKYDEIELLGFLLEVEIPEECIEYSFDEVQLRRVFENILSNSLRHNPAGTTIYITMQQTDRSIRMEIGDNGVGIPEEIKESIFEPFTVGDDSRNNRQGSGLGLAVAKKIVELHGGALFLEKPGNPAVSTLFVIRLLK